MWARRMTGLLAVLAILALVLYFNDAWRSLERARVLAREVCQRHDLQFLDGSVVQTSVRLERVGGRLLLARTYRFEFTTTGAHRHAGHLAQRGRQLRLASLDDPDGAQVIDVID
jgi:hypothetical protein